eukprot:jgi/Tetstr1/446678/TSEL_003617.t1
MEEATPDQLRVMDDELTRFQASRAWEEGHYNSLALGLIRRAKRDMQWLHVESLRPWQDVLRDVRAQFLFLTIKPARFYMRELHDMLRTKVTWSWRVKMTHLLRRDPGWWVAVPKHNNGRSIYKPVETA